MNDRADEIQAYRRTLARRAVMLAAVWLPFLAYPQRLADGPLQLAPIEVTTAVVLIDDRRDRLV
jgi:hypothetical protein